MQVKILPWRWVVAVCGVLTTAAVVFGVVTMAAAGPAPSPGQISIGPGPEGPEFGPPTAAELKAYLQDNAEQIYGLLRIAQGDLADCIANCFSRSFAVGLENVARRCEKADADAARKEPVYDPKLHEPLASALVRSCRLLDESVAGSRGDTPAWRARVSEAKQLLGTALAAEQSKPQDNEKR